MIYSHSGCAAKHSKNHKHHHIHSQVEETKGRIFTCPSCSCCLFILSPVKKVTRQLVIFLYLLQHSQPAEKGLKKDIDKDLIDGLMLS